MNSYKINSIIQFLELPNGKKITLVTNPLQTYADIRDKGQTGISCWCLTSCHPKTKTLVEATKKFFPSYFKDIIYV